jgi:hypothetical protein
MLTGSLTGRSLHGPDARSKRFGAGLRAFRARAGEVAACARKWEVRIDHPTAYDGRYQVDDPVIAAVDALGAMARVAGELITATLTAWELMVLLTGGGLLGGPLRNPGP